MSNVKCGFGKQFREDAQWIPCSTVPSLRGLGSPHDRIEFQNFESTGYLRSWDRLTLGQVGGRQVPFDGAYSRSKRGEV